MQRLQTELNIQWQFASQATPSPKAKVTMETLDRSRSDLSYHYDCVIQSLKQLNAHDNARNTDNGNDGNGNNECINSNKTKPDAKPVDKKVQIDSVNVEKKGKRKWPYSHCLFGLLIAFYSPRLVLAITHSTYSIYKLVREFY